MPDSVNAPATQARGDRGVRTAVARGARQIDTVMLLAAVVGLAAGAALALAGRGAGAALPWATVATASLVLATARIARDLLRRRAGVDVVAVLALAGTLLLGEYLAGAVIGLMLATGQALERYAATRAARELSTLLARAPRVAHRVVEGVLTTIDVDDVRVGDRLLVKEADAVPVDGLLLSEAALLDESALTGESRPVERTAADLIHSGAVNAGAPFELRATAGAADSAYAGIIRLVQQAQASKAPFVHLADRYAAIFVPVTLVLATSAGVLAHDPLRALAVLVVATPCPLLLAAPIAIVSGISRAARRGIIVKDGGALEALALGRSLYFDKTGTLTVGAPSLHDVVTFAPWPAADELLRLVASLDQLSSHVLAVALMRGAHARGLSLSIPTATREAPGGGIAGTVDGHDVRAGSMDWIEGQASAPAEYVAGRDGLERYSGPRVLVSVDGTIAGAVLLADPLRPDASRTIRALKRLGFGEVVMLTGDHAVVAESIGAALGVDRVLAERTPAGKVDAIREAQARAVTIMVGDGINDAPALAMADVGVAMGARGATSSSEAADVVLVADRLDRLVEAIRIARRSRAIAIESVWVGMGLSAVAMVVAAVGWLPPVFGALLQEGIDALAILSALRALRGDRHSTDGTLIDATLSRRLREEHAELLPRIERIRAVADRIGDVSPVVAAAQLHELLDDLQSTLLPHERADERELYPGLAEDLPGDDPLAAMSRTHQEIFELAQLFATLLAGLREDGLPAQLLPDVRRVLYGLHAVLRLHFAQEEELYHTLADDYRPSALADVTSERV